MGHLLEPGPRLSGQLAGGPLCRRTALEHSWPLGTHSQAYRREPLLAPAPYCCSPPAPGMRAQRGWPCGGPALLHHHQLLVNVSPGIQVAERGTASQAAGGAQGQCDGSLLFLRLSVHPGSHTQKPVPSPHSSAGPLCACTHREPPVPQDFPVHTQSHSWHLPPQPVGHAHLWVSLHSDLHDPGGGAVGSWPILIPITCPGGLFLRPYLHPQGWSWTLLSCPLSPRHWNSWLGGGVLVV